MRGFWHRRRSESLFGVQGVKRSERRGERAVAGTAPGNKVY